MHKQIYITDDNFIYIDKRNADLDPIASKRQGKPVYTGPFPYASFDKPPVCQKDEYAMLIDEKWQVKKRVAGVYYHTQTAKEIEITDPYTGDLSAYTKVPPPVFTEDDEIVFKNNKWVLVMSEESLSLYQNKLINAANLQCHSAIVEKYPPHKQFNLLSASMNGESQDFRAMHEFITAQRASCKALKARIQSANQAELENLETTLIKVEAD